MLRITVELVGGVVDASTVEPAAPDAAELAKRKAAGNAVELGSIAAVGFSPLWLLAAASDVLHGTRVYLDALVDELQAAGVLAEGSSAETVDDLLARAPGQLGPRGASDRRPAARARRPPGDARRAALEHRGPAHPAGARARLRGPAPRGGRRAPERPRGVERHGARVRARGALASAATTSRSRTARTGSRSATRASPRTRGASPARTARRSPRISIRGARRSPSAASPAYVHDPEEGSHSFEGVRPSIRAPTMCPCGSLPRCGATGATSSPTPAFGTSRLSVCA